MVLPDTDPRTTFHWTLDLVYRADAAGLFDGDDARFELLHGELVRRMTPGAAHAYVVGRLMALLGPVYGLDRLSVQQPIIVADDSAPEPDVAILTAPLRPDRHPTTATLAIEVSEATLRFDRTVKRALYARAGVPEYWIVNLVDHVVEVHVLDPASGRYDTVLAGPALRCPETEVRIAVADFLPPTA